MKRYGDSRLKTAVVESDRFGSTTPFNRLVVNSLSEVDQETLDHDVIILNKEDDSIYSYNIGHGAWVNMKTLDPNALPRVYFDIAQDIYNVIWMDPTAGNYLSVASGMLDLGDVGDPQDFVLDFWFINDLTLPISIGTILYNGLDTGPVDLEANMNMLISTSGSILLKDPNNQANPTIVANAADNGYLNVFRPRLKSLTKINTTYMKHVAIIRSGETTYLAIDGIIEASAPSVEYFHYDDVKIGAGYVGSFTGGIVNLRVTKGTDLGWTNVFDPPNYNPTADTTTLFLMGSNTCIDTTTNHAITIVGTTPIITQKRFHYQLTKDHQNSVIMSNLVQDSVVFRFPHDCSDLNFHFDARPSDFEIIPFDSITVQGKVFGKIRFNKFATFTIRSGKLVKSITTQQYDIDFLFDKFSSIAYATFIVASDDFIHHYDSNIGWYNNIITPNVIHQSNILPFKDSSGIIDCSLGTYTLKSFPENQLNTSAFQIQFLFYLTAGVNVDTPIISGDNGTTITQLILTSNERFKFIYLDGNTVTRNFTSNISLEVGYWYNVILTFEYTGGSSPTIISYGKYNIPSPVYSGTGAAYGYYYCTNFMRILNAGPWYISCLKFVRNGTRLISNFQPRVYSELKFLALT